MYNLIEYSNINWKKSGGLWQYHRDDPSDNITESDSFKYKIKMIGKTSTDGNTKGVKIAVPLKYLSSFWRTLDMPLINCIINPILTWSDGFIISSATEEIKFKTTNAKSYVPVITLWTQDNAKLLQ